MKNKIIKILLISALLALLICVSGCSALDEYAAERVVVAELEKSIGSQEIVVLDKYEISDGEYYYYLRQEAPDTENTDLLIIYNVSEKTAEIHSFADMDEEIEVKWNEVKNARPDKSFSELEISEIVAAD